MQSTTNSFRARFIIPVLTAVVSLALFTSAFCQDQPDSTETPSVDSIVIPPTPKPATNVVVSDLPSDGGGAISVRWDLSTDDNGTGKVDGYVVMRGTSPTGPFDEVGDATQGGSSVADNRTEDGVEYYYSVWAFTNFLDAKGKRQRILSQSAPVGPVTSSGQWFNTNRAWCFLFVLIVAGSIIMYIQIAKKGGDLFIRKIAGIDAVDEAVGRATEMGRKVFFIPGIQDMNDVQTIAGIAILGRVASLAAEYETWLEVPVSKSMVMVTARETMKEAYSRAGRPDSFQEAQVHYLTDDQFGYAAAIDGMVVREKPATIFYMGAFFAESLILAETGNAAGAIQIAGTAMPSQLPFFVAACDYTLIGEELFAASAYLSREPKQLGSLKGQDVGKAIFIVAIIIGAILETTGVYQLSQIFRVN
ncbi:MAG: fibronectin type III domain-containing protein [candidate division Zixibacteria bacterium]